MECEKNETRYLLRQLRNLKVDLSLLDVDKRARTLLQNRLVISLDNLVLQSQISLYQNLKLLHISTVNFRDILSK